MIWWAHEGSNLGPFPCEGNALPLSYAPVWFTGTKIVENAPYSTRTIYSRVKGRYLIQVPGKSHPAANGCSHIGAFRSASVHGQRFKRSKEHSANVR